jgi:hypothetical protein
LRDPPTSEEEDKHDDDISDLEPIQNQNQDLKTILMMIRSLKEILKRFLMKGTKEMRMSEEQFSTPKTNNILTFVDQFVNVILDDILTTPLPLFNLKPDLPN